MIARFPITIEIAKFLANVELDTMQLGIRFTHQTTICSIRGDGRLSAELAGVQRTLQQR
jgi:hypothetical protein